MIRSIAFVLTMSVATTACSSSAPDGAPSGENGNDAGTSTGVNASGEDGGVSSAGGGGSDAGTRPGIDAGTKGGSDAGVADGGHSSGGHDAGSVDSGDGVTTDAGDEVPDAGNTAPDAGASTPTVEFAPYFPTWIWGGSGYAVTSLVDYQKKAGVNGVTLAFVLSGGGCTADQGIEGNLSDVKAFIAAGGHVKASFGGADGTYVESQCSTAAAYAKALEDFVDATGIIDLDFDVEQDPVMTDTVNKLRGQGLAAVQSSRGIKVAFTLAANPSPGGGLTSEGLSVVSNAISAGVVVSHVNFMTMDYGDSYGGKALAPVAIGSLTDGSAQLMKLIPGLTQAQAWQMTGVIPMIGKNDDSEVFSLADATTVANFAKTNNIGLVSFWSVDRDQVCGSGEDYNSCSTVNASNFQFSKLLGAASK